MRKLFPAELRLISLYLPIPRTHAVRLGWVSASPARRSALRSALFSKTPLNLSTAPAREVWFANESTGGGGATGSGADWLIGEHNTLALLSSAVRDHSTPRLIWDSSSRYELCDQLSLELSNMHQVQRLDNNVNLCPTLSLSPDTADAAELMR